MQLPDHFSLKFWTILIGGSLLLALTFNLLINFFDPTQSLGQFVHSAPFFLADSRNSDFTEFYRQPIWLLPPASQLISPALWQLAPEWKPAVHFIYIAVSFFLLIWAAWLLSDQTAPYALITIICLCVLLYPLWFGIERGNFATVVVPISLLGIWAALTQRPYVAATLLTIAGCLKIIPLLLLLLLVAQRQWRAWWFSIALFIVLNLVALGAIWLQTGRGPDSCFEIFMVHSALYNNSYAIGNNNLGFSNSLFSLIRLALMLGSAANQEWLSLYDKLAPTLASIMPFYLACVVFLAIDLSWSAYRQKFCPQQLACLLVIWLLLAPYVSVIYYLSLLLLPLLLLRPDKNFIPMLLISLCLMPKMYFWFSLEDGTNIQTLLNATLLLLLYAYFRSRGHLFAYRSLS